MCLQVFAFCSTMKCVALSLDVTMMFYIHFVWWISTNVGFQASSIKLCWNVKVVLVLYINTVCIKTLKYFGWSMCSVNTKILTTHHSKQYFTNYLSFSSCIKIYICSKITKKNGFIKLIKGEHTKFSKTLMT